MEVIGLKLKRAFNWMTMAFNNLFSIVFIIMFFITLFFNTSTNDYVVAYQLVALLITLVLMVFFLEVVSNYNIQKKLEYNYIKILIFTIVILLFFQLYLISSLSTPIGWDVGTIVNAAIDKNVNSNGWYQFYFSTYPNNRFLFFLYRGLASILGSDGIWIKLCILNILAIDISIVCTFFIIKRIFDHKYALLVLVLSILLYGCFGWIIVPYSDILAMPFPVGMYLIYLYAKDSKNWIKQILAIFAISLLGAIGYLVKPTVIIFVIAMILTCFVFGFIKKRSFRLILFFAVFCIVIGGVNFGWKNYCNRQSVISLNTSIETPFTHFFMMGLNAETIGTFNSKDVDYTWSLPDKNAKIDGNMKVIKERLRDFGVLGYFEFLGKKAKLIFCEGDFFWGKEGDFAQFEIQSDTMLMKNIFYTNGSMHWLYRYITQGIWLMVLMLIGSAIRYKYNEDLTIINCTLTGLILFLLLFEMRSRYLILYLPFFGIASIAGLKIWNDFLHK